MSQSHPLSLHQYSIESPNHTAAVPTGTDVVHDSLDTIAGLYEYNHWIFSLIRQYVSGRVLEVGCGIGNITRFLSMESTDVVGIDPVDEFVQRFSHHFEHMAHVTAKVGYLEDLPEPTDVGHRFNTVVSCNVLEHIKDDVTAVKAMARQLREGGQAVVFVPAGPMAMGRLDHELGHYRRYTLKSLRRVMNEAGLEWVDGQYSNMVGLLGWWFNSVVLRRKLVPAKQAVAFNRFVPILSAIERMIPMPFGQSVVGVGRKPVSACQVGSVSRDRPI